jgi:hypothetical protein
VNSVNEDQAATVASSENYFVRPGCRMEELRLDYLPLGKSVIYPCASESAYYKNANVKWVSNFALVIDANRRGGDPPCINRYAEATDKYQACISGSFTKSLSTLFSEMSESSATYPDTIVLPAVGTGFGKFPKHLFYEIFSTDLLAALQQGIPLPRHIYLMVRRKGTPADWSDSKIGIEGGITNLVGTWEVSSHNVEAADWLLLVGVCGGLSLLLVLGLRDAPPTFLRRDLNMLVTGSSWVLVSWFLASLGLAATLKPVDSFFSGRARAELEIGLAFVLVFLTGPVLRAAKMFPLEHNVPDD